MFMMGGDIHYGIACVRQRIGFGENCSEGIFLVDCVLKVGEEAQTFAMRTESPPHPHPPQAGLSAVVWVQERVCYY